MKKSRKINKFIRMSNDELINLYKTKLLSDVAEFFPFSEYEIKEEILRRMYQYEES
jgi:hypothetical protein